MKILITGGHLTPALGLIELLQEKNQKIIFIGRKYSQDKNRQLSVEEKIINQKKISYFELETPKLNSLSLNKIFKLLVALKNTNKILKQAQPDVFVSFGGYLAVPVAIACYLKKIPIITHEQTHSLGMANKLISKLANKVALSNPNNLKNNKFVLTGNPIRKSLSKKEQKPTWFETLKLPLLFITGGSQGANAINQVILESLSELCKKFTIIHQLGQPHQTSLHQKLLEKKTNLPIKLKANYYPRNWLNEAELAWIFQHAQLAISRAGANTVQELQFFAIPSLLIPLPNSRSNEQIKNAQHLAKLGGAIIINQDELNSETLLLELAKLQKNEAKFRQALQKNPPQLAQEASENIYELILALLEN